MSKRRPSDSWWQTMPGMITAIAGLVTAVGGLLTIMLQAGIIGRETKSEPDAVRDRHPASITPSAPRVSGTGNWATALAELESRLQRANIQLSTDDEERVRAYMSSPREPYSLLAQGCLEALAGGRLKRRGHLDMIDKWYTLAVGVDGYTSDAGKVRVPELKGAIVKAVNEIHSTSFRSFEEMLEPR